MIGFVILACGLVSCRRSPEAKEAAYLKRAKEFVEKKDTTRALLELRNAAAVMPKDAEPYYQTGLIYFDTKAWAPALASFRKALELNPDHRGAQVKLAAMMIATRDQELMNQAALKLESVLQSAPDNPDAIDAMATLEASTGKSDDAAARLEEALKKLPSHLRSSQVLARLKLAQGDRKGAEEVLTKAVASAPKSAAAVVALAEFYLLTNRSSEAEAQFRKALQVDPENDHALLRLANLQMSAGRMTEAERTYKTLSGLSDKSYRPIHALFLYKSGKKEDAVKELERLNKNDPDDRSVRSRLIAAYLDMNRQKEAERVIAAALARNPKDVDALIQGSGFDLRAGRTSQAAEKLRMALSFTRDAAIVHLALAAVSAAKGEPLTEQSELNAALQLDPKLLAARIGLARNLIAANHADAALQTLSQAPPQQQAKVIFIIERNRALMALGRYRELRVILHTLLLVNRHPELLFQDALVRMHDDDYAGARKSVEELLRNNPTDVRAARVLADSYSVAKDAQTGLRRLSELAAVHPESAALQELLGEYQVRAGHLLEARQAFERARGADANFFSAEIALADLDRRENHPESARRHLTALATADGRNVTAQLMLAALDEDANDISSAIGRYRAALTVEPSNLAALNNLAYHLAVAEPDAALSYAQQAAELAPSNASVKDTVGWIYYRKGVYKSAVDYLKSAVEISPTPSRQFHLGMGYIKLGDQTQGSRWIEAALKADPNLVKTERGW
jgi:tetratricopeptide (TPR) repeat protein